MRQGHFLFISKILLVLICAYGVHGAESSSVNPLADYIQDLDEMGRVLSEWSGKDEPFSTWFFGAYAMYVLEDNSAGDLQPFPMLEKMVPILWSDFKYLTPRYLTELAGGTLSYGNLMRVEQDKPFVQLTREEQFIIYLAGMTYLHMLHETIGQNKFNQVIHLGVKRAQNPEEITESICSVLGNEVDRMVSNQFYLALTSGDWIDVDVKRVQRNKNMTDIYISYRSVWTFPVDVRIISTEGDTLYSVYHPGREEFLRVDGVRVRKIDLDPVHKLAEYYRYNNHWPALSNDIYLQPFAALPDWENHRIKINPVYWKDWDGDTRYGMKLTAGFGIDLWPAYPSDYRHRISWEMNTHDQYDKTENWGNRITYGHPISRNRRLFMQAKYYHYADWSGFSVGAIKYFGDQRFLVQGPRLKYQRLGLSLEEDRYADTLVWDAEGEISLVQIDYSALSVTKYGDRLLLSSNSAFGCHQDDIFMVSKLNVDLSGVFWDWLVAGIRLAAGSQHINTPGPYRFTHDYAWQDQLAVLPKFRGQTKLGHSPSNYLGLSLDGGYWISWLQLKLFGSSILYDQPGILFAQAKPHYAFGFGLEHKTFFTAGLYFPIWQSHPSEGEQAWAWRVQWRLDWNL